MPLTNRFLPSSSRQGLRDITKEEGSLLVFDEVMTGFRIAKGCAQEHFGITPDLTCMGKVIGGGLPVGAYGGRKDIMSMVAPAGPMYQAGTLSGEGDSKLPFFCKCEFDLGGRRLQVKVFGDLHGSKTSSCFGKERGISCG